MRLSAAKALSSLARLLRGERLAHIITRKNSILPGSLLPKSGPLFFPILVDIFV